MKKSKGFTLIELLAVIIVIIIVLAITVPIVSNMIETIRKEAFKATAYSISDSGRFLMANDTNVGYEEFYYLDGKEYNADNLKLDYSGDGPKTGVVILNERKKVALAIHNGTYCATKSADENKVTISQTTPEKCIAYNLINTCDTWEQIALKYDVTVAALLSLNNVTDPNSSTCGINIKIPVSSNSSSSTASGGSGSDIYYKTYYSLGYTTYSETFTTTSYEYTIKLGVLPLNISQIETVKVTMHTVYETLDDFKRYIIKKNMGEVIWPGEEPIELKLSQASTFKDHALRQVNMTSDNVDIECDTEACYATLQMTVNNMNNVSPNTINETSIAYLPIKFTVEFNGAPTLCTTKTTTDAVAGTLAGTGTSADPYLIESVEDLVALSNNVNTGNTYSGKYLSLTNTLDFTNSRSYKDSKTTVYGDINGNGIVEELKIELTTGAGFNPIGNGTNKFSGKLSGNTNCLVDFYINRPTTSYVGLVGYNNGGTITVLNLKDLKITGADYTGGLAGYNNNGKITEATVTGKIKGNNYVGLATGYMNDDGAARLASMIVKGNVTGADNVGGIIGYAYKFAMEDIPITGINSGGTIVSTGGNVGRILGGEDNYTGRPYFTKGGLALSTVTVNGSTISSTDSSSKNGANINDMTDIKDINLAEIALDTYISGDDDDNGYYWDYDATDTVVMRSVVDYPLTFSLAGSGTSADPYLINNYEELRQASLKQNVVYRVTSNIDMTDKRFYMLGSYINKFTGTFDGNLKTISNITINAPKSNYIGFVGYLNGGTITLMNLQNIDIKGSNYTGGLTGYVYNGKVTESTVEGNITAGYYVGFATGYIQNDSMANVRSIIAGGNITAINNIGGLVGHGYTFSMDPGKITGIYKGGNIVSTGTSVGRIVGSESKYTARPYFSKSSLAVASTTINGLTISSTDSSSNHGSDITSMNDVNEINLAEIALDTYIGGDDDKDGYYWDYNASGIPEIRSVVSYPLTFSLAGSGTTADPYLISNYEELRQASLKPTATFKLTADINLTGKKFYMLGSYVNKFTGAFNGDLHTISNLTINASHSNYIGFIGYLDRGTITSLKLQNVNISGSNYTGGLAGFVNIGKVSESTVVGNIIGNNYTGMAVGSIYNDGYTYVSSVVVEGNVTGSNYVGGLVGHTYTFSLTPAYITGINRGGSIISTGGNVGRAVGGETKYTGRPYFNKSTLIVSSTTVNGSTITSSNASSNHGSDITSVAAISDINLAETALDTYIGGDDDGNGYYWDYDISGNIVIKSTATYPLSFTLTGSGTTDNPYLINSYEELKQASLKPNMVYKLNANIDLASKKFYMLGSYKNNFTGTFDGNAYTVSNISIDAPGGYCLGFIGYSSGKIKGINLQNVNIVGSNNVAGLVGYVHNNQVSDATVSGNITGGTNVSLVVGDIYHDGAAKILNVIASGSIAGNDNVGGLLGHAYTFDTTPAPLNGIYKDGSIVSVGTSVGRIVGGESKYTGRPYFAKNASALSSITVNGSTIVSTDPTSKNGLDITASDLASSTTYTDRGFNFTDETLDYIWYIDGEAKFRNGSL